MSKNRNANVYSFTTTEDDVYLDRVVEEAAPDTDFIIVTERNTVFGKGHQAFLLVRDNLFGIALAFPSLTLAGRNLEEYAFDVLEQAIDGDKGPDEWSTFIIEGDPEVIDEELERVRNEIRRINNIKNGRVIRTTVESF